MEMLEVLGAHVCLSARLATARALETGRGLSGPSHALPGYESSVRGG